jgi:replication-associated recombination protein RarA
VSLYQKWRPMQFEEILAQPRAVKLMRKVARAPDQHSRAWLYVGDSGVGKTTLALVTASALGCTDEMSGLHYVGPGEFRADSAKELWVVLNRTTLLGAGWKCLIIDEGHDMSREAHDFLLGGVEKNLPPRTLVFITCNSVDWASDALLSRFMVLQFESGDEVKHAAARRLQEIWDVETGGRRPTPNFNSLVGLNRKEDPLNIRAAINRLEQSIMLLEDAG